MILARNTIRPINTKCKLINAPVIHNQISDRQFASEDNKKIACSVQRQVPHKNTTWRWSRLLKEIRNRDSLDVLLLAIIVDSVVSREFCRQHAFISSINIDEEHVRDSSCETREVMLRFRLIQWFFIDRYGMLMVTNGVFCYQYLQWKSYRASEKENFNVDQLVWRREDSKLNSTYI